MAHTLHKQEITVVNTFVHFKEDISAVQDLHAIRRSKTAPVNPDILEDEESDEVGAEVVEKEEEKQEESSPSSSEASEPNDGSPVVSVMNTFLHVFSKERSFHRSQTAPERVLEDEEDEELEDESEEEPVQPQLSRDVTADPFESPLSSTPERHQMPVLQNTMPASAAPVIFLAPALHAIAPMMPRPGAVHASQVAPALAPCLLGRICPVDQGLKKELMPGTLRREMVNGRELVRWSVDARKLDSHDTKVLSPQFDLEVPGQGLQPFRLMVLATQTSGKGGASFQKAGGRGRITLKCESSLADARSMALTVTLSSTARAQHGPIWHNFSEQSCCSVQEPDADWNFKAAVDRSRRSFQISMQVVDHA